MFGGIVDLEDVPLPGRLFSWSTGGRAGDRRDWPAITQWASDVGAAVRTATTDEHRAGTAAVFRSP